MARKIFWLSLTLFSLVVIKDFFPLCKLESAYQECGHDPHSGEPCDTWISTNYAGLDNGGLTGEQCKNLGVASNYVLGASGLLFLAALGIRFFRRKRLPNISERLLSWLFFGYSLAMGETNEVSCHMCGELPHKFIRISDSYGLLLS